MAKRLYRSPDQKIIAGVCGGLAEYFDVDVVWMRVLAILLALANGVGVLAYIVFWIVTPVRPRALSRKP